MKSTINNYQKIKRLTIIALFCAMSFTVSVFLPIFVPPFLTLDFKDAISTIGGMFFGPIAGLFCAIVVPFIEFITNPKTGVYGLIMNLLSSVTFVGVSSLIYKYKKTIKGAVAGLGYAVCATVSVMLLANLFVTPHYMGVSQEEIVGYIPKLLLPFNLVKTVLNASIVMLIYKPISKVLKRMGLAKSSANILSDDEKRVLRTRSLIVTLVSATIVVISCLVLFLVLGGKFQ